MDKLVLTDTGGFPLKLDDLLWQNGRLDAANKGIYDAIQAHLLAYGTDFIVEGAIYSAPNITAGWIMLNSELMRVDAAAGTNNFFVRTVTFDARGDKTFKDTSVNSTYEKIRGVLSGASGSLNITTALRLEDKIIQLLATSTQLFAVGNIPSLPASKITSGIFVDARIPSLATSKITSGIFVDARIPSLAASKITTGIFVDARIPSLDTSKITSGIFVDARIPSLAASKITSGIFAVARLPQASETASGALEIATQAEAQALTADNKIITPAKLADVNGGLLTKIINIGDWDMDTDASVFVSHSLDSTKIRTVQVSILSDTGSIDVLTGSFDTAAEGGVSSIGSTTILLKRLTGGKFNNTSYQGTGFNRGFIIIQYIS